MRPLIAAEPMLRMPRPEIVAVSAWAEAASAAIEDAATSARINLRKAVPLFRVRCRACLRGHLEGAGIDRDVGFRRLDGNDLLAGGRRVARTGGDREREIHAVHQLVIAEIGFGLLLRAAD